jgi:hypothetical protein
MLKSDQKRDEFESFVESLKLLSEIIWAVLFSKDVTNDA